MFDLKSMLPTGLWLAYVQSSTLPSGWAAAAVMLLLFIVGAAALVFFVMRRALRGRESQETSDPSLPKPSLDNPSAFMAASMQAVIQKLREQEKELAALHRRDRERAQQTERLSEAVTRNMPAGLLLISSAGLITSANPAAEAALDVHALAYRRYAEVFGKESSLSRLLATCLSEGRLFVVKRSSMRLPKANCASLA